MAGTPQIPRAKVDAAVAARRGGATIEEAAKVAGVSTGTVKRAMRGAGKVAPMAQKGSRATPLASDAKNAANGQPGPSALPSLVAALEGELLRALEASRTADGTAEQVKASGLVRALVDALARHRPEPAPTREELEAKHRPRAEDVLGKIRNGVKAVAQREAETGRCHRCGQDIPAETVLRRRIEAGMADPVAVH